MSGVRCIIMWRTNKRKRGLDHSHSNSITISEDVRQLNALLNTHWPDNNTSHIAAHGVEPTGDEATRIPGIVQGCINDQGSFGNSVCSDAGNSLVMNIAIRQMNAMLNTHWPNNNATNIDTHNTYASGDESALNINVSHRVIN